MSSVQYLREFVNQRLTAAAEEIFGVFEKTIVEYEAELERQRRLLDILLKPEIKLHRIELPQQHVCKDRDVFTYQQLWNQQRNSSLDQEDPESPQIKEEQVEVELTQETNTFMFIPAHEEIEHSEAEANSEQQLLSHSSAVAENHDQRGREHVEPPSTRNESQSEKRHHSNNVYNSPTAKTYCNSQTELPQQCVYKEGEVLTEQQLWNQQRNSSLDQEDSETPQIKEEQEEVEVKQETNTFLLISAHEESVHSEPEANSEQQLLSHSSAVAESQDQRGSQDVEPGSTSHCNTHTGKKTFRCDTCGKDFQYKCTLKIHQRIHTGERPFGCDICGKRFSQKSSLTDHVNIHTDEKPYGCDTCGRRFTHKKSLTDHIKIHTGEKPYLCKICGKSVRTSTALAVHKRTHTGEKPYVCETCGKRFTDAPMLKKHMRIHTGEKPYSCITCGKCFGRSHGLLIHMRTHTGEKPYSCDTCGKRYSDKAALNKHVRIHPDENPFASLMRENMLWHNTVTKPL